MMALVQYTLFLQIPEINVCQEIRTEGQAYEMVQANNVVTHRSTLS